MDQVWEDAGQNALFDYLALGVVASVFLAGALLSIGGLYGSFIVSKEYAEHNFIVALVAATIGALLAVYLMMTWLPVDRFKSVAALVALSAGLAYLAVDRGIPATVGPHLGIEQVVTFVVTDKSSGGRRSCRGIKVSNTEYVESKLCRIDAEIGMRVQVTGKVSWFGIAYRQVRVLP